MRAIEIDFKKNILKIDGKTITSRPIIVTLPGEEDWPVQKLFNPHLANERPEACDELTISYCSPNSIKKRMKMIILTILFLNVISVILTIKDYRHAGIILKALADGISLIYICTR